MNCVVDFALTPWVRLFGKERLQTTAWFRAFDQLHHNSSSRVLVHSTIVYSEQNSYPSLYKYTIYTSPPLTMAFFFVVGTKGKPENSD